LSIHYGTRLRPGPDPGAPGEGYGGSSLRFDKTAGEQVERVDRVRPSFVPMNRDYGGSPLRFDV